MARVTVSMFATVREAASASSVQLDARDLDELISALSDRFGKRLRRLLDESRSDPERLIILLNGRNIPLARSGSLTLADGDEISIFPPVSGG